MSDLGDDDAHALSVTLQSSTPRTTSGLSLGGVSRLQAGDDFGRYQIAETVGQGSMGVVYRAVDHRLQRSVALKLLHAGDQSATGSQAAARARLLREARSMAKLSHPNVLTVYDVDTIEGRDYIAMEFIEGCNLASWLADRRTTGPSAEKAQGDDWSRVLDVYRAAGRGLAAAHDAGLVHRDFKPHNILMSDDGRVLVTDFGLARMDTGTPESMDAEPSERVRRWDPTLTKTGSILGTPAYMAPEQHRGDKVDERADQYSFCAALFQGLYGILPFSGASLGELRAAVEAGEPAAAPAGSRVPERVRAVLLRGMARLADERYPSMHELLQALTLAARRPRRRWLIGGLLLVGLALVLALYALSANRSDARSATARPVPAEPNARAQVNDIRTRAQRVAELYAEARLLEAHELAKDLLERARALDFPPLVAEMHMHRGRIWRAAMDIGRAQEAFERARQAAEESNDVEMRARAYVALLEEPIAERVDQHLRVARGALDGFSEDLALTARYHMAVGDILVERKQHDLGRQSLERALALFERAGVATGAALSSLGLARLALGHDDRAAANAALDQALRHLDGHVGEIPYMQSCLLRLALEQLTRELERHRDRSRWYALLQARCEHVQLVALDDMRLDERRPAVDGKRIAGRVMTADGQPAAHPRVLAGPILMGNGTRLTTLTTTALTEAVVSMGDESGHFEMSGLASHVAVVMAETDEQRSFPVLLADAADERALEVVLRPLGSLRGRIANRGYGHYVKVDVTAIPMAAGLTHQVELAVNPDAEGGYQLSRLAVGRYRLVLGATRLLDGTRIEYDIVATTEVQIDAGQTATVDFELSPAGPGVLNVLVRSKFAGRLYTGHVYVLPDVAPNASSVGAAQPLVGLAQLERRRHVLSGGERLAASRPLSESRAETIADASPGDWYHEFAGLPLGPASVCAVPLPPKLGQLRQIRFINDRYPEHLNAHCVTVEIGNRADMVIVEATPAPRP